VSFEENGLPPRHSRKSKQKSSIPLKKVIRSGLIVFGVLFFGLIGFELYRANIAHPSVPSGSPVVTTEEVTPQKPVSELERDSKPNPSTQARPAEGTVSNDQEIKETASAASPEPHPNPVQPAAPSQTGSTTTEKAIPPKTSLGTASPPPTTGKNAAGPKTIRHVVKKGETLFMLSRKYYGNNESVSRIARYNGFHTETQLTEGNVVMIPISQ
jgi:nucleoid-associated protein YgaU